MPELVFSMEISMVSSRDDSKALEMDHSMEPCLEAPMALHSL